MNHSEQTHNSTEQSWLNEVNTVIDNQMEDSDFVVEKMAKAVFMCERNFYRKFKKLTGSRPGKYLSEKRLEKAKELLENRKCDSVKELSWAVGYEKPDYFSNIFQARFGKRPIAYIK